MRIEMMKRGEKMRDDDGRPPMGWRDLAVAVYAVVLCWLAAVGAGYLTGLLRW